MKVLQSIFNIGIPPSMQPDEAKYIRMVNVVVFYFISVMPIFILVAVISKVYLILFHMIVICLTVLPAFIFNYLRLYNLARIYFFLVMGAQLSVGSLIIGKDFLLQYYFFVFIFLVVMTSPKDAKKSMVVLIAYNLLCYQAVMFFSNYISPLYELNNELYQLLWKGGLEYSSFIGVILFSILLRSTIIRTDDQLKEAQEKAETANRLKSEFIANISHEMRTPMNAIIGFTELASRSKYKEKQLDYLRKIKSSSHALLGVINDVLDFSKIEAKKLAINRAPFNLNSVLDSVIDMFSEVTEKKGLEFMADIDDIDSTIAGDALRLRQVLINLMSNAVKFTEKGEILLKVSLMGRQGDQVLLRFSVQDTGIGIAKEYMPLLFETFTQADGSATRRFEGTGLGLSICKQLVNMMGGTIEVESVPAKGSTFSFSLDFTVTTSGEETRLSPPANLEGMKVLVVDDNKTSRRILEKIVRSLTFDAATVSSGEEAIQKLARISGESPYRLLLIDFKMPAMDGITAAEKIRKYPAYSTVPILLMTSLREEEKLFARLEAVKIDDCIVKPIKRSELFDAIMQVLDNTMKMKGEIAYLIPADESQAIEALRGARVLLVEDNSINRQVVLEFLEDTGISAACAVNGREALQLIRKSSYDAVLMDIQMPEMDGYEATEKIRAYEKECAVRTSQAITRTPIIALTAHAIKNEREKCLESGMDDHIAKPIDTHQLFTTLARWINPGERRTSGKPLMGRKMYVGIG